MKIVMGMAVVVGLAGISGAGAQTQAPKKSAKVKEYDFSKEEIDAGRLSPVMVDMPVLGGTTHASLIKLRKHFIAEVLKTAEDL